MAKIRVSKAGDGLFVVEFDDSRGRTGKRHRSGPVAKNEIQATLRPWVDAYMDARRQYKNIRRGVHT